MTYSILFSSHRLLKVLDIMTVIAILVAILRPYWGSDFFSRIERAFRELARQRYKAMLAAALFPMIVRALMLPWYPPPPPQIHDEFSYLLQGDTFAHGRIANPTPPYWQHFETEYTLLKPTYASQYQPAQGIILAIGEVIFGHPWFGVWISMGVMYAAFYWALGYIVPPAWALFGAFASALQFGIFGIWMNSYFGGAAAATAGALIMGSLVRMQVRGKTRSSAALGAFGVIILFASRPFEALLWLGVVIAWVFLLIMRKPGHPRFSQIFLPFVCVFLLGSGLLAFYNWRITGNPANPPYLEYRRIYGTPQPYWWQGPVQIGDFDFPELRNNYLNQVRLYEHRYSFSEMFNDETKRVVNFWRFFVGPFFTPALLFGVFIFRDRRIRPWLYVSIPFILDKATYHAWFPAHNAPSTVLWVLVLVQCWRHMVAWGRRRGLGLAVSRQLVVACSLTVVLGGLGRAAEPILPGPLQHHKVIWESMYPARRLRDDVTAKLERIPGKHLLFVKYSDDHCFCEEWVFNLADLGSQRIIYSRVYTPESDEALARHFSDYDIWLVEPDEQPYRLVRLKNRDSMLTTLWPDEDSNIIPEFQDDSDGEPDPQQPPSLFYRVHRSKNYRFSQP